MYLQYVKEIIPEAVLLGQTLVFLPGKAEIAKIREEFEYLRVTTFHSQSQDFKAIYNAKT